MLLETLSVNHKTIFFPSKELGIDKCFLKLPILKFKVSFKNK